PPQPTPFPYTTLFRSESSLDILETLIRDALMLSLGVRDDQIVNDDLRSQLAKVAERINAGTAASWIAKIEELREQLVVNINRKVDRKSTRLNSSHVAI